MRRRMACIDAIELPRVMLAQIDSLPNRDTSRTCGSALFRDTVDPICDLRLDGEV